MAVGRQHPVALVLYRDLGDGCHADARGLQVCSEAPSLVFLSQQTYAYTMLVTHSLRANVVAIGGRGR